MGENNIFTEIMELIEKTTNMPILEKDLENWLFEKEENKNIYQIYKLASEAREFKRGGKLMDILLLIIYIIEIILITISIFTVKKAYETLDVNLKKKKIDVIDECMDLNKNLIKKLTKILVIVQSEEVAENKIEQIKEVIKSANKNNF